MKVKTLNAASAEKSDKPLNYLKDIRQQFKVKDRDFAERSGIAKTTLLYIENTKPWSDFKNLEILQYAKGLNITHEELVRLHELKACGKDFFTRFSYKEPQNSILLSDGVKFIIFASVKYPFESVEGQLEISPTKSLLPDKRPIAQHVRWRVLEGSVVVYINGGEMIRKKDDGFILHRDIDYEIYNSNAMQKAVLSLVTLPSFIRIGK